MKLVFGILFCVAVAAGTVLDEFRAFKSKYNKSYRNEAEVILNKYHSLKRIIFYIHMSSITKFIKNMIFVILAYT